MTSESLRTVFPNELNESSYKAVEINPKALCEAQAIVEAIKLKGESAVLEHAVRLGDLPSPATPYLLSKDAMRDAYEQLKEEERALLRRTAGRITAFAEAQRKTLTEMEVDIPGGKAGQTICPMNVAGCYAPGGRYPLPSSVLMTAITARVAGVRTVVVASPRPTGVTLAAAYIAGADSFLCVGGAQAIAAMAYGIGNIPSCDIVVGPGNRWVTAAKALVFGKCAIDMLAGPSECLVIGDDSSPAEIIAADLLAQAEHDISAIPILVTTSKLLAKRVNAELELQLSMLTTRDVASVSLHNGFIVLCQTMDECIAVSDRLAPEHLEIMTADAKEVAARVQCYGGLFIGKNTAEVYGDYGVAPNHVLPTGGTARYTGGLSVHTFLRIRTWMRIDEPSAALINDTATFARMEGLEGHARAAEKREV